jgi:predicted component of type VI protein secretion system
MPPRLVALSEGPDLLLDKPILLLGRHQECDIQLSSRKISRRHCCIAQINNQLLVRDLCSTNGIRINGVRVTESYLKDGDQLTVGNYNYRLQWEEQPAAARPAGAEDQSAVAAPPRPSADPMLSCDLPVPLAEMGGLPFPIAHPLPQRKMNDKPSGPPPEPAPPVIVPDDLHLAPLSDMIPGNGQNPPGPTP